MTKSYSTFSFSCTRTGKERYEFVFEFDLGKNRCGTKTMEISTGSMKMAKKIGERYFLRKLYNKLLYNEGL